MMAHSLTRCVTSFCAAALLAACGAAHESPVLDGGSQSIDLVPAAAFASPPPPEMLRAITSRNVTTSRYTLHDRASESESVAVSLPDDGEVVGCTPAICSPIIPGSSCRLTGGAGEPFGLTSDRFGDIWAADYSGQRAYACNLRRSTTRTLQDPGGAPLDVAVAREGTVAVMNYTTSVSGPGDIAFYAPGSDTVTNTVTGLITNFTFGAFDKKGNLYDDGFAPGGVVKVGIVRAGSTHNVDTGISGIGYPGGIMVARNGTINVMDQECRCIGIFKGSNRVGTVTLGGSSEPMSFAFDRNNAHVWVADSEAGVLEYAYPAGGSALIDYVLQGAPYGIAVIPR